MLSQNPNSLPFRKEPLMRKLIPVIVIGGIVLALGMSNCVCTPKPHILTAEDWLKKTDEVPAEDMPEVEVRPSQTQPALPSLEMSPLPEPQKPRGSLRDRALKLKAEAERYAYSREEFDLLMQFLRANDLPLNEKEQAAYIELFAHEPNRQFEHELYTEMKAFFKAHAFGDKLSRFTEVQRFLNGILDEGGTLNDLSEGCTQIFDDLHLSIKNRSEVLKEELRSKGYNIP